MSTNHFQRINYLKNNFKNIERKYISEIFKNETLIHEKDTFFNVIFLFLLM